MTQSQWRGNLAAQEALRILNAPPPRIPFYKRPLALFLMLVFMIGIGFGTLELFKRFPLTAQGELPLVSAPTGPYKVRPEGQSAHEVPHKDKTIYDQLSGQTPSTKEVTLRAAPEAPVEAPPSLPVDFIKALSQAPITSQDLESAKDVSSPFVAEETAPFEEREGFFQEGTSGGAPPSQPEDALPAPAIASARWAGLPVQGESVVTSPSRHVCMEFCVAPTRERAEKEWQAILRRAGHLLATLPPVYVRVDHGRAHGVRYHLRVSGLIPERAKDLQANLALRGVTAWLLPE